MRRAAIAALLSVAVALAPACTAWRAQYAPITDYAKIDASAQYAKLHTHEGTVYVLERWTIDPERRLVEGDGIFYGADRALLETGHHQVPFDRIALVETTRPEQFVRAELVVMGILTGAALALTAVCLTNTKACFGSCPTFYAESGLVAEGFSSSISRTSEATDVDALPEVRGSTAALALEMRNEALETHLVQSLRLIAVPKRGASRVARTKVGEYFPIARVHAPASCRTSVGGADCRALLSKRDGREYLSRTDGRDLAARESIELRFPHPENGRRLGLALTARSSLLDTYLFYQALAYMGRWAGDYVRAAETRPAIAERATAVNELVGGIEARVRTKDGFERLGSYDEIGPIARDELLFVLPADLPPGDVVIELELARGSRKIDEAVLAELSPATPPIELAPREVLRDGKTDHRALANLLDREGGYVITYPGDALKIVFDAPPDHALFLEARGYYYEWIREQWLAEEDPNAVAELFLDPRSALRTLAPAYARVEADLEKIFFNSKVGR